MHLNLIVFFQILVSWWIRLPQTITDPLHTPHRAPYGYRAGAGPLSTQRNETFLCVESGPAPARLPAVPFWCLVGFRAVSVIHFHRKFAYKSCQARPLPGRANFHPPETSTDCLRACGLMKTPVELEVASSTHNRSYTACGIERRSEGLVRMWPKYSFLLSVLAQETICERPFKHAYIRRVHTGDSKPFPI